MILMMSPTFSQSFDDYLEVVRDVLNTEKKAVVAERRGAAVARGTRGGVAKLYTPAKHEQGTTSMKQPRALLKLVWCSSLVLILIPLLHSWAQDLQHLHLKDLARYAENSIFVICS